MKRQIIDTIASYDTIVIHRHVRPDPDAYGSQHGLKALILANYPNKKVFAVGEHDESLSFMTKPDSITDDVYDNALVIVTDTANTERIDDQRYTKGKMVIKIDHHPNDDPYGDLLWVNTEASSCSEMIYTLFEEGREALGWILSDTAARLLFAGIIGDTGRFQFSSTTAKTFQVASELVTYSFDRDKVFNGMYEMEQKLLNLQGYIYQNFQMDEYGAASIKLTKELLAQHDVVPSEASLLVGCLGSVKGIQAWVVFIEEDKQIRVRLRSKGPIINTLAKEFNGGGHPLASGATAYSWTEADRVIQRLQEVCQNNK
ncbi:DHH family phosphoesterase [Lysinibacillus piscis]|uniref:Bifunctional oligoribonuclease and PAP phosphatase NrnA n=1 Tax=Lysinibacillus piscis TaxID=2518931 RepID=A0ABQ5NJ35_9BACI|nr:bifunctional oligoribonuclease/PAP phosphatase NrnA [Lysinibacillus sp. KH24]GLC88304.1 bifunctional oligoribonuclease and PAP phosphatase NrnA [Lysinibacillus sp. KH24]